MLSAFYFQDGWWQNSPYPVAQGGANVPGFNALNAGHAQLLSLGDTKTFESAAVNEFHFSFLRDVTDLGDWSQFEPISGIPNYLTDNKIPYTQEYMLSIQPASETIPCSTSAMSATSRITCSCCARRIPAIPHFFYN
jgi:hypothetical protein